MITNNLGKYFHSNAIVKLVVQTMVVISFVDDECCIGTEEVSGTRYPTDLSRILKVIVNCVI